jgi:hypothetical protein
MKVRPLTGPLSRTRWLACLVRGHRWDVAPRRDVPRMRCVRCGMTAEPFTPA